MVCPWGGCLLFAGAMINMMLGIGTKVSSYQCAIVLVIVYIIKEWETVCTGFICGYFGICQCEQTLMVPMVGI